MTDISIVITRQGEVVGQGITETGERKHRHRAGRKQNRSGERAARQAGDPDGRRRSVRQRGWTTFLRDIRQNIHERAGIVHGHREEATAGPGRTTESQSQSKAGRQPKLRGASDAGRRCMPMLSVVGWFGSYLASIWVPRFQHMSCVVPFVPYCRCYSHRDRGKPEVNGARRW